MLNQEVAVVEKIAGPLGWQVEIENLPTEFSFFEGEDESALVHIPCGKVITRFGINAGHAIILQSASEHIWCPALGAGVSVG